MGVMFEYTGVVKKICPLQKFDSGFQKQELILTDDIGQNPTYPNILCFSFKKDRVLKLNGLAEGMRVKVTFAIDGREWTDNSGNVRYYTDLTALKLDVLAGGVAPAPQKPLGTADTSSDLCAEDVPF